MRPIARIAALAVLAGTAASISPAAWASAQPGWRLTDVVRPCGRAPSGLLSVSAVSAADAWALGYIHAAHCATFLEHWNGRSWRTTRIAADVAYGPLASPIVASSAADVWLFPIGSSAAAAFLGLEYALNWNGHRWRSSELPRPTIVTSAEAFGGADAWAFGVTMRNDVVGSIPYAARYDGKRWRVARMPGAPLSVGATSATDMWAVGPTDKTAARSLRRQTLIAMHWNGRSWRTFALPPIAWPNGATQVTGHLVAVSSTEFWWQYDAGASGGGPAGTGVLHCAAGHCQQIALPPNVLGVLAMSADGSGGVVISALDENPVTYNSWQEWYDYTGGQWHGRLELSPKGYNSEYSGLAWIPGTDSVWSVGEADANSGRARVLTEGVIAKYG